MWFNFYFTKFELVSTPFTQATMTNIYVLRLEGGRYYIGKSDNVMARYSQHLSGGGSAWTRKYRPVGIEKTIENVSDFQEDAITKEYMSKHGIEKVRGGAYVEVNLDDFQIETLNREIWGAKDCCTQCGRKGHWVKDCSAKTDVTGNKIEYEEEWGCDYCIRTFTTEYGCRVHEKSCRSKNSKKEVSCYRCGRGGHYTSGCYASTHRKGYTLDSDSDSDENSD